MILPAFFDLTHFHSRAKFFQRGQDCRGEEAAQGREHDDTDRVAPQTHPARDAHHGHDREGQGATQDEQRPEKPTRVHPVRQAATDPGAERDAREDGADDARPGLERHAHALREAGLMRVNISLDTLDAEREALVEALSAVVRIPSVVPSFPGERPEDHIGREGDVSRLVAELLAAGGDEGNEDAALDLAALQVAHRSFVSHAILLCLGAGQSVTARPGTNQSS